MRVFEFEIDDDNRDKFARHGLTAEQVDQVLGNRFSEEARLRRQP